MMTYVLVSVLQTYVSIEGYIAIACIFLLVFLLVTLYNLGSGLDMERWI
jgi:hypothetical protein